MLVGVRLTARSNRTSMALGRTATISGQVVPAHRGQRVRLQHKQGRTWRTVQAKTLPASGRYSFALRPRATGTSWWRIHTGRGTTRAGHLFLGSGRPIWNNDGDTANLIDPHNVAVSRYRY